MEFSAVVVPMDAVTLVDGGSCQSVHMMYFIPVVQREIKYLKLERKKEDLEPTASMFSGRRKE